jgi:hypothetical protein
VACGFCSRALKVNRRVFFTCLKRWVFAVGFHERSISFLHGGNGSTSMGGEGEVVHSAWLSTLRDIAHEAEAGMVMICRIETL